MWRRIFAQDRTNRRNSSQRSSNRNHCNWSNPDYIEQLPYFFDPRKYQRYIVAVFGLLFVALLPTCIVQLLLLKLIFKEVKKYEDSHLNVKGGHTLCDPVLRMLQRKANVTATVSFLLLYMAFIFLLYGLVNITVGN